MIASHYNCCSRELCWVKIQSYKRRHFDRGTSALLSITKQTEYPGDPLVLRQIPASLGLVFTLLKTPMNSEQFVLVWHRHLIIWDKGWYSGGILLFGTKRSREQVLT